MLEVELGVAPERPVVVQPGQLVVGTDVPLLT